MKYQELRKKLKTAVFTRQDLKLRQLKVFNYQLSLWQKQGYLIKLKNGVYLFADEADRITPEEITPHLYSPSYISLEKALSIYGLIPEMVYGITSITPKTTRRFKNDFGSFIYRHIKPALFFGYQTKNGYLLAEPEKALLDYFYLNRINNQQALAEVRLNRSIARKLLQPAKLKKYARAFNNSFINKIINAEF